MTNTMLTRLCLMISMVVLSCSPAAALTAETELFTPWSAPTNLGPPINTAALDGCPFIAANGVDLIFASNRAVGSGPTDLYMSRFLPFFGWSEPVSLGPEINTPGFEEFCPMLTVDGQHLFFVSNRRGGCGGADIYSSRRIVSIFGERWTKPRNLGCQVNSTGIELSPSLFEDEDGTVYLYFSSGLRPGGMGFGDIYYSTLQPDGTFGPATPVAEFNTPSNEIRPNIRRDGLEIFFDSNRPGSIGGSPDLYTSTRETTSSPWSTPVNLGPMVNSAAIDGRASLSWDGTQLYFMSNRPGGFGDQDIYVVTRQRARPLSIISQ